MPFRKSVPPVRLDQVAPATEPQQFLRTLEVASGIAQAWETPYGPIAVVFPNVVYNITLNKDRWRSWIAAFDGFRAVVVVGPGRGLDGGPDLFVHDRAITEASDGFDYEISWFELSRLLGRPAPYWATFLRTWTGMSGWSPAEPERVIAAAPEVDLGPVLRLAARHNPDTALHQALVGFARDLLADAAKNARKDIEFHLEHRGDTEIRFAARPADVADGSTPLELAAVRAGWLHALELADDDAAAAVGLFLSYGRSSAVLPASTVADIKAGEAGAAEWLGRLRPCQRTAKFALLPAQHTRATLVDPLTQSVVAFDGSETYYAAVPSRIPSPEPLAAVELQPGRVWIRTSDGTKYLCPETGSVEVNWGYNGTGPRVLAQVLHALLEDINVDLTIDLAVAPEGLVELCKREREPGTVLTREELEKAQRA